MPGRISYSSWTSGWVTAIAAAAWILAILLSLLWNLRQVEYSMLTAASVDAQSSFEKDLVYRRWTDKQGGVYVPPTDDTPPNPYLSQIPERDVTTTSGKQLTLINPEYMIRLAHGLEREQSGARVHLTSLQPIRPKNAPDAWEAEGLRAFEAGAKEKRSVEIMDREPYLRLMHPLTTEAACLKCHAVQGYKVGDIRGGISVSVPLAPYAAAARGQKSMLGLAHVFFGGLGLAGLWMGSYFLRRSNVTLQESEERYRLLFEGITDAVFVHGIDAEGRPGRLLAVNGAACRRLGYTREELLRLSPGDIDAPESTVDVRAITKRLQQGERVLFEQIHTTKDGRRIPVEINVQGVQMRDRYVVLSVVRDIAVRKLTEEEHKKLQAQLAQAQKMEPGFKF